MVEFVTVTCRCANCNGITARVPLQIAQAGEHAAVVLATMPYGESAGCTVVWRPER